MKIKLLAIALLSTTLIASPLLAKDKVKPVNTIKKMDKYSPASLAVQTSANEMEVAKKKTESDLNKDIDKASTKELKFGTRVSTEGQAHRATVTGGGDSEELQSSKGYIKIGDIKGNSTKASSAIPPSISGLEVTAPSQSAISDESNDGEESDCDDLKENERCVDGHVTVLK